MNRKQRVLAYIAAGIITGLIVAMVAIYTISRTEFGQERVRKFAVSWLTQRVDGTVHIGQIAGRGLLGGLTLRDFYIIDKRGRPFLRADSATLAYNWRTLVSGSIVIEKAVLHDPVVYLEQLPGDTMWNYQHVFPDRSTPGAPRPARRLILFNDARIINGSAIIRRPFETPADAAASEAPREVIETVPGGLVKTMRFDSIHGELSRVIWESPVEPGRLIDIRSMRARGYVWQDPMHLTGMRGTVTVRDTIVTFDIPDARFPSSRASVIGRVIMEEGQNFFDIRVDSRSFTFRDMQWIYPKLPDNGGGSGVLRIQSQRPKGVLWLATDTRIVAPGTRMSGSFGVVTGADSLYFTNVALRASPLNLRLLQDMLPDKLPLDGLLVGTVEIKGGLSALDTRGDVRLSTAAGASSIKWRGQVDARNGFGARDLRADVQQFDLALLNRLRPDMNLRGRVTGHVEASGRIDSSVRFAADVQHTLGARTSSFLGTGTYTAGAAPQIDVQLNAQPLSFSELADNYPALKRLQGEARGPIRASGALDELDVEADLETAGGRAQLNGRLTRTGATPRYSGKATLYTFRLDHLIADLPETSLDGVVHFDIAGKSGADASGTVSARLVRGRVRSVDFRDAQTALTLDRGLARVDTLFLRTFLGDATARGTIGLNREQHGSLDFSIRTDSIAPLNASPDGSKTAGRVRGTGNIAGSIHSFDLQANVDITHPRYGSVTSDRIATTIKGSSLGSEQGTLEVRGRADSLIAYGEHADTAGFLVTYGGGRGAISFAAGSSNNDEYVARANFETRPHGLLFALSELRIGQRDTPWKLTKPAALETDDHGFTTEPIEVRRENGGQVRAAGRIAWHDASHTPEPGQASDFRLDFEGVPFTEFALATLGESDVKGVLSGHVRTTGSATAPIIESDATVTAFQFGDAGLDHLTGSFTYAEQRINARIDAEKDGRRVLFADGIIPANLAFVPVADRKLAAPLRFTVQADSAPAAFLTSVVGGLTDVQGRLDGTLLASGTTQQPQLTGTVKLAGGRALWDATGVRYRDVNATMRLEGERVASLEAQVNADDGRAQVNGTIDFARLANPRFNLKLNAQNFPAAKRRDAQFIASGEVALREHYRQPVITGAIAIEKGALFLDELYRRYQIVELDNPLLYDVVDTSIVSLRTIMPRTQNPFVKNLVVQDLRVDVGREAWLRSRDLNVEVSGDLTIAFLLSDTLRGGARTAQDLRLTGNLRAVRGTYQLYYPAFGLARQFAIREGTIEFPGTPGVDPNLGFNAIYRARSKNRDPIDIVAVVGGTLRTPRVRLTSDEETPISESDLVSYLFFGAPTYELSASQNVVVSQATSAFTSSVSGYLASGLQSFAQNVGLLDYVSLSAAEPGLTTQTGVASLFAGTQLELGWYWGDAYIAWSQRLTPSGYMHPGVRVEWRFVPTTLTGEFFVEDRFARSPDFGIQNSAALKKVYGLFLYREWGY